MDGEVTQRKNTNEMAGPNQPFHRKTCLGLLKSSARPVEMENHH